MIKIFSECDLKEISKYRVYDIELNYITPERGTYTETFFVKSNCSYKEDMIKLLERKRNMFDRIN